MEQSNNQNVTKKTKKPNQYTAIRVSTQVLKKINSQLIKANKKDFGKRVKTNELLEVAVELVTDGHIKELQNNSLSNADLLEMKYREHIKRNGKISKDEFLGILLNSKQQSQ